MELGQQRADEAARRDTRVDAPQPTGRHLLLQVTGEELQAVSMIFKIATVRSMRNVPLRIIAPSAGVQSNRPYDLAMILVWSCGAQ